MTDSRKFSGSRTYAKKGTQIKKATEKCYEVIFGKVKDDVFSFATSEESELNLSDQSDVNKNCSYVIAGKFKKPELKDVTNQYKQTGLRKRKSDTPRKCKEGIPYIPREMKVEWKNSMYGCGPSRRAVKSPRMDSPRYINQLEQEEALRSSQENTDVESEIDTAETLGSLLSVSQHPQNQKSMSVGSSSEYTTCSERTLTGSCSNTGTEEYTYKWTYTKATTSSQSALTDHLNNSVEKPRKAARHIEYVLQDSPIKMEEDIMNRKGPTQQNKCDIDAFLKQDVRREKPQSVALSSTHVENRYSTSLPYPDLSEINAQCNGDLRFCDKEGPSTSPDLTANDGQQKKKARYSVFPRKMDTVEEDVVSNIPNSDDAQNDSILKRQKQHETTPVSRRISDDCPRRENKYKGRLRRRGIYHPMTATDVSPDIPPMQELISVNVPAIRENNKYPGSAFCNGVFEGQSILFPEENFFKCPTPTPTISPALIGPCRRVKRRNSRITSTPVKYNSMGIGEGISILDLSSVKQSDSDLELEPNEMSDIVNSDEIRAPSEEELEHTLKLSQENYRQSAVTKANERFDECFITTQYFEDLQDMTSRLHFKSWHLAESYQDIIKNTPQDILETFDD